MVEMISPRFSASKFDSPTTDDLIDVFEDRVSLWLLKPAKSLLCDKEGAIAGFCLTLTYFEGYSNYVDDRSSKGRSKEFFVNAFVDVFRRLLSDSLLRQVAEVLYADARCGFFHDGMFRDRIYFMRSPGKAMQITLPKRNGVIDEAGEIQSLLVDPKEFYSVVVRHFTQFVASLRNVDNSALREKFVACFKAHCDWTVPGRVIGINRPTDVAP